LSDFYTLLDQYLGSGFDNTDIRVTVRRCWFYDFLDYPIYVWQGQGNLFTSDGNKWLGTIDANGNDQHITPAITDGRDGSSPSYNFTLKIPEFPGLSALDSYTAIKEQQTRAVFRNLTCYLALLQEGEGLRPETPIVFFKQLVMFSPKFSEKIELGQNGEMIKRYYTTVSAKDGNYGRSNVPGGTYADTVQKERARQLGVDLDRGSEFLALLANRTYQLP
jgi:hypothetical protein